MLKTLVIIYFNNVNPLQKKLKINGGYSHNDILHNNK